MTMAFQLLISSILTVQSLDLGKSVGFGAVLCSFHGSPCKVSFSYTSVGLRLLGCSWQRSIQAFRHSTATFLTECWEERVRCSMWRGFTVMCERTRLDRLVLMCPLQGGIASAETAHVDLQFFLLHRPPYPSPTHFPIVPETQSSSLPLSHCSSFPKPSHPGGPERELSTLCYSFALGSEPVQNNNLCTYWDWAVEEFWARKIIFSFPFLDKILGQESWVQCRDVINVFICPTNYYYGLRWRMKVARLVLRSQAELPKQTK